MKPLLNMKPYTITRTTAPDTVVGRTVLGAITTLPITANVQPVGKKLSSMPEARRSEEIKRFFTSTEIYVPGQIAAGVTYNADIITIKSIGYEVFQVDEWPGHFECFAAKMSTP